MLSIAMTTYNHASYIRQALDSILMQDVDFDYEIVVGDDCSPDSTQKILQEYERRYPGKFKLILRDENVGATKNIYDVFINCTGKYIAILEGDDFWTSTNKIKKQVEFLETNDCYIACTHRYSVVDEFNNVLQPSYIGEGRPEDGIYTLRDFEKYTYFGHIGTLVFRNIFLINKQDYTIIYKADDFVGDITLCMILAALGDVFVMSENMCSYRSVQKKDGTNYCSTIAKKNGSLERFYYLKKLEEYCQNVLNRKLKHEDRLFYYTWMSILYLIRFPSAQNWNCLKKFHGMAKNKIRLWMYIGVQLFTLPYLACRYAKKKLKRKNLSKMTRVESPFV